MTTDTGIKGIKVHLHLGKWEDGRTPDDGPPDAVVESIYWTTLDGVEITDPAQVAELEQRATAQARQED